MKDKQFEQLMEVLNRIALALENLSYYPYTVTYQVPAPAPEPAAPHVPNPYWNPPTYQPVRFDYHTGDPLPPQRPENIC